MTEPPARSGVRLRSWLLVALGAAAIVESVLVRHFVYPALSWNRDEAAYLWQAGVLRSGHLVGSTGGTPEFFQPWLTGITNGHFFSQYTLGWPGLMALSDRLFDSPAVAISVGLVLAVLGTYLFVRELTHDATVALVAAILMLLSPIVILQSGVYLSYLFALGIGTLFGAALLSGVRNGSRWRLAVAGMLLGLLFITRPLDAVLWAIGLGGYAVLVTWRAWSRQLRILLSVAIGLVPFVVLTLLHNRAVTGSFTGFPFTAKEALDTFGFGARRLMPQEPRIDYTVGEAIRGTARNTWYLPQFLAGTYVALVLALVGVWLRRGDRSTIALLLLGIVFPAGYFLFWGNRLSSGFAQLVGPIYFIPVYVSICVLVATPLLGLWRNNRILAVVVCCVAVASTAPYLVDRLRTNARVSAAQAPWRDATDALPGKSLVVVQDSGPYLLHLNPYSLNAAELDGRVLYAADRGAQTIDLLSKHADRTAYIERTDRPDLNDALDHPDAAMPKVTVRRLRVVRGAVVTLQVHVRARASGITVVQLRVGSRVVERTFSGDRGAVVAEWQLVPAGSAGAAIESAIELEGSGDVSVVAGSGTSAADALSGSYAQVEYVYQAHASMLEVLQPGRAHTMTPVGSAAVASKLRAVPVVRAEATSR